MELITNNTIFFYAGQNEPVNSASKNVATPGFLLSNQDGHVVNSYVDLLTKVASLSYYNTHFQLLFRGQKKDYKRGDSATSNLYPSILRKFVAGRNEQRNALDREFELLGIAEQLLIEYIRRRELVENQIVRWAILQHYDVCKTPLLDVTASLQIALTFAIGRRNEGWLYVLAFPHLTGGVSVSVESKTQVINLSQLCPPEALRPHFQQGLLASDYPEIRLRKQSHGQLGMRGNNFSARLLTKFKLQNCDAWNSEGFTPTPDTLLFPNAIDLWYESTQKVREKLYA
jgi:FRG domain